MTSTVQSEKIPNQNLQQLMILLSGLSRCLCLWPLVWLHGGGHQCTQESSAHYRRACTQCTVHRAQWKAHSACPVLREKSWLWAIEKSEMMGGGSGGDNGPWATSANPTSSPPPTCKQITPRRQWAGCSQNMQAMDQIDRPCSSTPSFNFLHDLTNNEKGSNSMLPSTQKHISMFFAFYNFLPGIELFLWCAKYNHGAMVVIRFHVFPLTFLCSMISYF